MLQAIVKKGKVLAEEVPAPVVSKGMVLIKVMYSCISAGTEMSTVNASKESLLKKIINQPEKAIKVLHSILTDGVVRTYDKISGKLASGTPVGYSVAGIVIDVGEGVTTLNKSDIVAATGAGFANHAEFVTVPENLVVKIPKDMDCKFASTVALGSIALQGIRRADLKIGEFCVVIGSGILGLLAIQMLKISGIRVIAIDLNERRLQIAKELGAEIAIDPQKEDPIKIVENFTGGYGADAVLFTAATNNSEPLSQSFKMCKKKGRVVLIGVSGMEIKREDIYAKELDFMISTSYGPGRYDAKYEEKGLEYPYAYIRWTENRNMQEYLRLVYEGKVKLDLLINAVYPIQKVSEAYEILNNNQTKPLIVLINYGNSDSGQLGENLIQERKIILNTSQIKKDRINIALIGAGSFAMGMHLPNIQKLSSKYKLYAVMSRNGYHAKSVAAKYGAKYATTAYEDILNDSDVDLIMICTRHDSHAELTLKALEKGKNVFVEKPLAVNQEELDKIKDFYSKDEAGEKPFLMVGFNRRFSRYAQEIKKHTDRRINPLFIHYRMNAGFIPLDHWAHEYGGRIVGEGCHIIDLMTYFTGSRIESVNMDSIKPKNEKFSSTDNLSVILKYDDGSICTIEYFAVGNKNFPKEYMEVHFDEKTIVMDDYKKLKGYGVKINEISTSTSQKGQLEELEKLYETLKGNSSKWPIELWDMIQTTETTFKIVG